MLFEGRFEVTLRQLSGEAFPDLSKDGKAYVVGLPGAGYIIELRALPRAFAEASRTIRVRHSRVHLLPWSCGWPGHCSARGGKASLEWVCPSAPAWVAGSQRGSCGPAGQRPS